jgi:hypothetical protein
MVKEENKILIYSPLVTERLQYICHIILNQVLGLNYEITNDKKDFEKAEFAKFSYDYVNNFKGLPFISAHNLLFETDIHELIIDAFIIDGHKAFFKSSDESYFPFDIFAASFYLISRYEEYLPFKADKYGRFCAEESLAFKEGFLEQPLVNIWAEMFCVKLCTLFPHLKPVKTKFQFLATIDVDNAWAHLNKGFLRTSLSFTKYLLKADIKDFKNKFRIVFSGKNDPYDNYEFIEQVHKKYGIVPIYFFLFSKFSCYDKNPSCKNVNFRNLIKSISRSNKIGMHPSFRSHNKLKMVESEKNNLEKLIERPVDKSRQHYLLIKMPETYDNLIRLGIKQDFSMGYSSYIGFRASFCMPFKFFNLKSNKETSLEIVPFALMDVCFTEYLKIQPQIALKKIKNIITSIKNVNGLFVSLWHNETLMENNDQTDWRFVYEQMLKEIQNGNQAYQKRKY